MYTPHQLLREPEPGTRMWRYMDLAKFLHLLESKTLHLAALRTFDDPFEGHPPKSAIDPMTAKPDNLTPELARERRALIENNMRVFLSSQHCIFASCWHMNETESAGMWAQYLRSGAGLVVQTTFERLVNALLPEGPPVSGAVVQYIDFESHGNEQYNIMAWGALKRASFSHEREFRLLSLHPGGPAGLPAPVSLEALIEQIYVAPTTPNWLYELVISLLPKYGLSIQPLRSELDQAPRYMAVPEWARDA